MLVFRFFTFIFIASFSTHALAWGKRGHQIVGETAALLASKEPSGEFLKAHSFDMGYYNNVPDLVWKKPKTYKSESNNHFMDLEIFEEALKKKKADLTSALKLTRSEFEKKYPEIKEKAGRAFWRISEMTEALNEVTQVLRKSSKKIINKKQHQALQEKWLVLAGTLGHYVADLSQPLHVSENYDGQLTDQKGIHHIYETVYVDELYPKISVDVLEQARKDWKKEKEKLSSLSLLELLQWEASQSQKRLKAVLELDKKLGRKDPTKIAKEYRSMIVEQLASGGVTLAEIFHRHLQWEYVGDKFYFFGSDVKHIDPGPLKNPVEKSFL